MATRKQTSIGGIDAKWMAQSDMETLARAKEIEADKSRLAAAQKIAMEKIKQMQSIATKKVAAKK